MRVKFVQAFIYFVNGKQKINIVISGRQVHSFRVTLVMDTLSAPICEQMTWTHLDPCALGHAVGALLHAVGQHKA